MTKLFLLFELSLIILLCFENKEVNMQRSEVEDNEEKFPEILGTLTLGIALVK